MGRQGDAAGDGWFILMKGAFKGRGGRERRKRRWRRGMNVRKMIGAAYESNLRGGEGKMPSKFLQRDNVPLSMNFLMMRLPVFCEHSNVFSTSAHGMPRVHRARMMHSRFSSDIGGRLMVAGLDAMLLLVRLGVA